MNKITYEEARQDHEYLWSFGPAEDMTGAYVDQEDLRILLESPTKATARKCYIRQIEYWLVQGPEKDVIDTWKHSKAVAEIAERYGSLEDLVRLGGGDF